MRDYPPRMGSSGTSKPVREQRFKPVREQRFKPVREQRFVANIIPSALVAFRTALVDFAGGFTEMQSARGTRYVVGMRGRDAKQRMRMFLDEWESQTTEGRIELEDHTTANDRDEIYFLLPLLRNPDHATGKRLPLFSNEELGSLRQHLGRGFHYRPEMVQVYGQWKNEAGVPVPDCSFLIRVPRRNRQTVVFLRSFIRNLILGAPSCDQDCIYLSDRWQGHLVWPETA